METHTTNLHHPETDEVLSVTFNFYPKGKVAYDRFGKPLDPEEPDSIEITEVRNLQGETVLFYEIYENLEKQIWNQR